MRELNLVHFRNLFKNIKIFLVFLLQINKIILKNILVRKKSQCLCLFLKHEQIKRFSEKFQSIKAQNLKIFFSVYWHKPCRENFLQSSFWKLRTNPTCFIDTRISHIEMLGLDPFL